MDKGSFTISRFIKGLCSLALGALLLALPMTAAAEELPDVFNLSRSLTATENDRIVFQADNFIPQQSTFELQVAERGVDSARLSWHGDRTFLSYTLCRYNIFTSSWEEYAVTTDSTLFLSDLSEDTDYRFALLACTGELLATTEFTTAVKNVKLHIKDRASDSITLSFRKGSEAKAVVLYRSTDNEHYIFLGKTDGETYTDTDLQPATTYYYKVKSVIERGDKLRKSELGDERSVTTLKPLAVPEGGGAVKTFAYYTAVNVKSSPQYKLLNSSACTTDPETGVRMVDGCYCVAMGSFYGTTIGTKYKVTFEDGKQIDVILCDAKSDRHTNETHQYGAQNKDILEFYIEKAKIPDVIRRRGNYGNLPQFSGAIVSIEQYID